MLAPRGRGGGGGGGGGNGARGRGGRPRPRGPRGGWPGALSPVAPAQHVQVVPPMNDQRWQRFRDTTKRRSCNFFEYHRRGLSRDPTAPWDDPNNLPLFREPPPGTSWDGRYPPIDVGAAMQAQRNARVGYDLFGGGDGPAMRQKRVDAEAAAARIRDRLASLGGSIRLVKVLGFGGNGIASLFEVWPGAEDDGPGKKVVIKSLLREGRSMAAERSCNMMLKRARHIIQPRLWGREIMPTEDMEDDELQALRDKWAPIDNDNRILTLEFMRGGDLHHLIVKLAQTRDSVPQTVLWRIFFCLVRGCIAMYSPPRTQTRRDDGTVVPAPQLGELVGPNLDEALVEYVRGSDQPPAWNLVHYDLDPQNVLIGETDQGQHPVAPIFKISDLGLGKTMDDPMFRRPNDIWEWRRMGKTFHLLPEQYHKEWDYIKTIPTLERHQVAGRYGPWSNIFPVGLCMQSLITKAMPPYPPQAIGPLNSTDHPNLFDTPTVIRDSAGAPVQPFHTHGFNLVSVQPGLDEDFMHLLLRCLADLPADRPTLAELEWLMERMEGDGGLAIVDEDVLNWCDLVFREPAPPPASPGEGSLSFQTADSAQRPDVFATAASQGGGVGNDRPPLGPGGDHDFDDDGDDDFHTVPLGGESFVVPDTPPPASGASGVVV